MSACKSVKLSVLVYFSVPVSVLYLTGGHLSVSQYILYVLMYFLHLVKQFLFVFYDNTSFVPILFMP